MSFTSMSWLNEVNQKLETFKIMSTSQIDIPSVFIPPEPLSPTTTLENRSRKFKKALPGGFPVDEEQGAGEDDEMNDNVLDGSMVQDTSDDEYPLLFITREVSAATSGTETEKEEDSDGDELDIFNQYAESRSSGETLFPVQPPLSNHTTQPYLPTPSSTFDPLSSSSTLASNDLPKLSDYSILQKAENDSISDDTNWSTRSTYSKSNSLTSDPGSFEMEPQDDTQDIKYSSTPSFPHYYSILFNPPSKPAPSKSNNINKPLPPPPVPHYSHPNNSPTKNSQLKSSSTTPSTPLSCHRKAGLSNLKNQEKVAKKVDMTTFFGNDTSSRKAVFNRGVPWGFHGRDYQPPMMKKHFLVETMRDMKVKERGIMERGKRFVRRWKGKVWDFVV